MIMSSRVRKDLLLYTVEDTYKLQSVVCKKMLFGMSSVEHDAVCMASRMNSDIEPKDASSRLDPNANATMNRMAVPVFVECGVGENQWALQPRTRWKGCFVQADEGGAKLPRETPEKLK